jgi:hypothetical protein
VFDGDEQWTQITMPQLADPSRKAGDWMESGFASIRLPRA